jgi:hypothetical protein
MTRTTLRAADRCRRIQTPGSTPPAQTARFSAVLHHGAGRARRAPATAVRSPQGAGPMWSLLLPSYCTNKPTEDAMPDPDAGPSHEPGARILGSPS